MKTEKERIIHAILKDELEIRIKFKKYQEAHMYETRTPLVTSKPHWSGNQLSKHAQYLADRISDRILKENKKKQVKNDEILRRIESLFPKGGGWSAEYKPNRNIRIIYKRGKFVVGHEITRAVPIEIVKEIIGKLAQKMKELRKEVIL